jgi:hypothetical protein
LYDGDRNNYEMEEIMRRAGRWLAHGLRLSFVISMGLMLAANAPAQPQNASPSPQASSVHLVGVRALLDKKLDARRAKVGDVVIARPEAKVQLASGVVLATSSQLIGRVDTVKASENKGDSAISVTFDKARMKDGREIPIKATILWIGAPPNQLDPAIVSAAADRTTPGVGVEAGQTQTPPDQGYQGSEIAGAPKHKTPSASGDLHLPPGISLQVNAIPGVTFSSDMGRKDSGWFRSQGRNVFVPGGTVLAFAIVAGS